MKFTVAAALLSLLALATSASALELPPELKEIVAAAHEACQAETGVADDVLKNALKGNLVDDPKLKCFTKCMYQHLQAMQDDGTIDLDLIEASLPDDIKEKGVVEALKQCLPTPGKDLCQAAFDMSVCMHRVNPELSQLFD